MSKKECCCPKGDCERCPCPSCDEDGDSVSSRCEISKSDAQCENKGDKCCEVNLSTPDQFGKDKDGCCPCNMNNPDQCGKGKDVCCPCNMNNPDQCGKGKDGCCPCNMNTPDQCGKGKDGCHSCNLSTCDKCSSNGHCLSEDFKQETYPDMRCAAKDKSCSLSVCNSDECDKVCCRAEEWSCTSDSCTTGICGTCKQCASCHSKNPNADKCCINGCKPIHDDSDKTNVCASRDKTNDCASRDKTNDCASRDKTNDCASRDKTNDCASRDKTNVCASRDKTNFCASRDKTNDCGSPTEKRCCGNDVRTPDCGEVKDVFCDPENPIVVNYPQICEAKQRIEGSINKTPCERSEIFSEVHGLNLYFKKDFLQPTGSFKVRGAFNALLQLSEDQRESGVIAASAGNHALALAHAGSKLNITVTVVMPTNAALVKIQKNRDLNARVELFGQDFGEAERHAMQLGKERGLLYVNGYDHPDILAGQGTMGCEIFEQLPHVDAIVVPVGGGGLIAGVSAALKHLKPDVEIYGVESEKSTGFKSAMEAGKPVMTKVSKSLAEGLSVPKAGANALATARPLITELVSVKEYSIEAAMKQLKEKENIVVEGAGAAGLAAIIEGKFPQLKGKTVVVVLCGANIDSSVLRHVMEKGINATIQDDEI